MFKMSCEGCSKGFSILKRKKKCEDCGYIYCSDCTSTKGRLYQCYRCKIFTHVPLNFCDVSNLKLRDLQWFIDLKGIDVPSNDRREQAVMVDWIMNYFSRLSNAQQSIPPNYQPIYPNLHPGDRNAGGLFGTQASSTPTIPSAGGTQEQNESTSHDKEDKPSLRNGTKHGIINLDSVDDRNHIYSLTSMQLKVLLTRNSISFRGCVEKSELQQKVCWLWDLKEAAKNKNTSDENLCKICMEAPIDTVLLDCGHLIVCHPCGTMLQDCPICRQNIKVLHRVYK